VFSKYVNLRKSQPQNQEELMGLIPKLKTTDVLVVKSLVEQILGQY